MSQPKWVVRVVTQGVGEIDMMCEKTALLEMLRYAGLVRIHRQPTHREPGTCFDLLPPKGIANEAVWAEQTAAYMITFGVNAVKAPPMP